MSSRDSPKIIRKETSMLHNETQFQGAAKQKQEERDEELTKEAYITKGMCADNPEEISSESDSDMGMYEYMFESEFEPGYSAINRPIVISYRDEEDVENESRLMPKLGDPGAFIVDVSLEKTHMGLALIDSGSSLNIFPKSLCDRNWIFTPTNTPQKVRFADTTRTIMTGHMHNMIMAIGKLRFKIDLVVMAIEEQKECPIILGRAFINTSRALMCMTKHEITLYDAKGSETYGITKPEFPIPPSVNIIEGDSAIGPDLSHSLGSPDDAKIVEDRDEREILTILSKDRVVPPVPNLSNQNAGDKPISKTKERRRKAKRRTRRVREQASSSQSETIPRVGACLDSQFDCLFIGHTSSGKAIVSREGKTFSVRASRVKTWQVKASL